MIQSLSGQKQSYSCVKTRQEMLYYTEPVMNDTITSLILMICWESSPVVLARGPLWDSCLSGWAEIPPAWLEPFVEGDCVDDDGLVIDPAVWKPEDYTTKIGCLTWCYKTHAIAIDHLWLWCFSTMVIIVIIQSWQWLEFGSDRVCTAHASLLDMHWLLWNKLTDKSIHITISPVPGLVC